MGFAVLFKFFQYEARFPTHKTEVPKVVIQYIARGVGVSAELFTQYDWTGRAITYHRTQIRDFFGFRENTVPDADEMINERLNVVENWNSANSFIFYGKGGEIATNRLEDQELAVLSLHLLQNCLVYINTIMLQNILKDRTWYDIMAPEDFRALTPLIYTHVNPYGTFRLIMSERIPFEEGVAL